MTNDTNETCYTLDSERTKWKALKHYAAETAGLTAAVFKLRLAAGATSVSAYYSYSVYFFHYYSPKYTYAIIISLY